MRRIFSFLILAASLVLAPTAAFAQLNTNMTVLDKILVDRVDVFGNGLQGTITIANLNNGTGQGYGPGSGAGGVVTQGTSRANAVVLNTFSGQITMFNAAGATAAASFTVTNSKVVATDTIILSVASGSANSYVLSVTAVAAGSFQITYFTTGGVASDAPVINYAVVHAATS